MLKLLLAAFALLTLPTLVLAHGAERVAPEVTAGGYIFTFVTEPEFPVVGRETHLNFNFGTTRPAALTVVVAEQILAAEITAEGFDMHYTFTEAGEFPLTFTADGVELSAELLVTVNELGVAGWWRISFLSVAVLLLLLGIWGERRRALSAA